MGTFLDGIPVISDVLDVAQKGYNFIKDLTNTDNKRAVDASNQVQEFAFGKTRELQEIAQQYGAEMFGKQVQANKEAQAMQFAYNSQLANPARDAYLKRMSGLNPAENTQSYTSQVGLPQASVPSSPAGSVGASSFGAVHYDSNSPLAYASYKRDIEQGENTRIANMTALDEALARIDRYEAETEKLLADKKISEEEAKIRGERANRRREIVQSELDKLHAETYKDTETGKIQKSLGEAAKVSSDAAASQADAAHERNQIEKIRTEIEKFNASSQRMQVNINSERLSSEISKLQAEADKFGSDAQLSWKEVHVFDKKIDAVIDNIISDTKIKDAKTLNELRQFISGLVRDVLGLFGK